MKVLLLSDPNSSHTIKWAKSLSANGVNITIFGLGELSIDAYDRVENIKIVTLNQNITKHEGKFSKIKYLKSLILVRKLISDFKPDILHAHYASSYGLIGALSGFNPFILSVWGSDIFSFPKKTFLHKYLIKFNLSKADKILSTSHIMAEEIKLYTYKNIEVTPFGIDMKYFKPMNVKSLFYKNDIVIGTIKTLEEAYGIEYLIKAFKILSDKYEKLPLKLLIVGEGSLEFLLKKLIKELNIENKVIFRGKVSFDKVPKYHNMLTIYVSVSNSESFGVAVLEASSCAKPVVVSNIGGLTEVVEDKVSGFIVPPKNPKKTAEAIEMLILNKNLRLKIGRAGRERVRILYNWNDNVSQMLSIYKTMLKSY